MKRHELSVPKGTPSALGRYLALALFVVAAVMLLGSYLRYAAQGVPYAGTPMGRWCYGSVALVTLLYLALYNVRHKIYRVRLGSLQAWFWGHVWVGTICLMAFAFHVGFRVHGLFNWLLTLSFLAEILSGFVGLYCYLLVRPRLMEVEERPTLAAHHVARIKDLTETSHALLEGKSPQLAQAVNAAADALLAAATPYRILFSSFTRAQLEETARALVARHSSSVPVADRAVFEELVTAHQRLALSRAELFLHRLLRGWVPFHVVLAGWLLTLVVAHLVTVGYY
jgi:hypothetical protein